MVDVTGRTVLVTGGRRGLGAALVDALVDRGARRVYSTAREAFDDPREVVRTHPLEVTSQESIDALAAVAGDVDIVINNAGVLLPAPLLTGDLDDVSTTFDVNVFGPLRVVRAFAPILASNGGGAVIDIHSVLSWLGGSGAYGASKAAMWSVTNSLRSELAEQGTHVLGVHAAFIDTEMVADIGMPKTPAPVVAARILDALADGAAEVLTDDVTVATKAALSGPVENLTFALAH